VNLAGPERPGNAVADVDRQLVRKELIALDTLVGALDADCRLPGGGRRDRRRRHHQTPPNHHGRDHDECPPASSADAALHAALPCRVAAYLHGADGLRLGRAACDRRHRHAIDARRGERCARRRTYAQALGTGFALLLQFSIRERIVRARSSRRRPARVFRWSGQAVALHGNGTVPW
jgi:hypothetical protein